MYIVSWI